MTSTCLFGPQIKLINLQRVYYASTTITPTNPPSNRTLPAWEIATAAARGSAAYSSSPNANSNKSKSGERNAGTLSHTVSDAGSTPSLK